MDSLKLEQALTDGKISSFLNNNPVPQHQKTCIKYDERLDLVISEYDSYNIVFDFLIVVVAIAYFY